MGMMEQMMEKIDNMEGRMKESDIRNQATRNTLFEEINALKEHRFSKSTTPRNGHIPNLVPEVNVGGGEEYGGWHGGVDEFGGMRGDFGGNRGGNMKNEHFGIGNGGRGNFGGGNGMHGQFEGRYPRGGMELYGSNDQFRGGRKFEEEPRLRFDDPSKTFPSFMASLIPGLI